ncbi:hypothetical protein GLO73106DRAFT_00004260 [Gloeocapsa sp. PCC 73106]|nr:hypothetical protein GLO73106DRAFT_00004260 [Gloeocapsa sp. PCC 73106]
MLQVNDLFLKFLINLNIVFAQRVEDPKIFEQMQDNFNNFIESGQVWALGIGLVLGYLFRSFTSY